MTRPRYNSWMADLPDDLPVSEINLPGAHNAAAIDTTRRTRWACQDHSIGDQLAHGIRLLDIRLKPKKIRRKKPAPPATPGFEFITCHGHLGFFGANEYQPFEEIIKECAGFLKQNPTETIVMTLQIDDWRGTRQQDRPTVLQALKKTITRLPLLLTADIPTLQECRGKVFLINRIDADPALGVSIDIPDNTPGTTLEPTAHRHYEVYVQDQYRKLNRSDRKTHKLRLTIAAIRQKKPGVLLLNYASATKPFGRFVYIMRELALYFAQHPLQKPCGWLLTDYARTTDLTAFIIASNFDAAAV